MIGSLAAARTTARQTAQWPTSGGARGGHMTASERELVVRRRSAILTELRLHGSVRVVEIAERFNVSLVTARRDVAALAREGKLQRDRKSTRLNSSHVKISYAVFCLKKKKTATARNAGA